jgi:hypothetical protein
VRNYHLVGKCLDETEAWEEAREALDEEHGDIFWVHMRH